MKKLTCEEFVAKAKLVFGDFYNYDKFEYVTALTKGTIVCPVHGEFQQRPNNHVRGQGCVQCAGLKKLDTATFIKRATKKHKSTYDYSLVDYKNNWTNVTIVCLMHGEFSQKPNNHLNGQGCPSCSNNRKLDTESFKTRVGYIHQNKYDYSLVVYENTYSMITIICPKHGKFVQRANNHINGQGCPICKESKGEKLIRSWLTKNQIKFSSQYKIFGCKNERSLLFDFAIFDNNNLIGLIEYNGEFHHKEIKFSGTQDRAKARLENQQMRDKIKVEYCKDHKIPLLVVSYNEMTMINNFLQEFVLNKDKSA